MNLQLTTLLCTLTLVAACGGELSSTPDTSPGEAEPPATRDGMAASPTVSAPDAVNEVIELQSSGSLGFKVFAGRVDDGWCAHLVNAAGDASSWRAEDCQVSTAAAEADLISYAIADAPADPDVKVFYGLMVPPVSKVVIVVESGSVTSSVEAGPAKRAELGETGSFSLFVRPGMGQPAHLRLLDANGSELRTIDL